MPRLLGITVPENKRIDIGLTVIYGVGRKNARRIVKAAGIDSSIKASSLSADDLNRLTKAIEETITEGNLRKIVSENIKRLKTIGSYRGMRHNQGLPSRGQQTRTNARTRRGKRKTIGALRKEDAAKLEAAKKAK